MNRALIANADLSFEITPDLPPEQDSNTTLLLTDTEKLLRQRREMLGIEQEEEPRKPPPPVKTRTSPRIARKLRFSKHPVSAVVGAAAAAVEEDMDTS